MKKIISFYKKKMNFNNFKSSLQTNFSWVPLGALFTVGFAGALFSLFLFYQNDRKNSLNDFKSALIDHGNLITHLKSDGLPEKEILHNFSYAHKLGGISHSPSKNAGYMIIGKRESRLAILINNLSESGQSSALKDFDFKTIFAHAKKNNNTEKPLAWNLPKTDLWTYYLYLPNLDWVIVVLVDEKIYLAPFQKEALKIFGIWTLLFIGGLFFSQWMSHRLIRLKKQSQVQLSKAYKEMSDLKSALEKYLIISVFDITGTLLLTNKNFENLIEYDKSDIINLENKNMSALKFLGTKDELKIWIKSLKTSCCGRDWKGELTVVSKSGCKYWLDTTVIPTLKTDGSVKNLFYIQKDITKKKESTNTLLREKKEAVRANSAKTTFLSHISHEVRTPLTSIIGFSKLIKSSPDLSPDNLSTFLNIIERNCQHLSLLIGNILDISKIEAEELDLRVEQINLKTEILAITDSFAPTVLEKEIDFKVNFLSKKIPQFIYTDLTRFKQILINIIGNAMKATEKGRVEVSISVKPDAKNAPAQNLTITVEDTGTGIELSEQSLIFQPFYRGSSSWKATGTGLGLSLSKQLAQRLGGNVLLEKSVSGVGSKFKISISLNMPHDTKAELEDVPVLLDDQLKNIRILVAEDYKDNQVLIEHFLKTAGAKVTVVENGRDAVKKAQSDPFDVIIMDIEMPILNGAEATKILKAHGLKTPIIALTAHATKQELDKFDNIGFATVLTKPYTASSLINAIFKLITTDNSKITIYSKKQTH